MPAHPTPECDPPGTGFDPYRKMLRYRAWHRGTREADLLIGPFADAQLSGLNEADLSAFEALLNVADDKLTAWIMHGVVAEAPFETPTLQKLRHFQNQPRS